MYKRIIIIIIIIIPFYTVSYSQILDRIIAYGEEDDIVITLSDLVFAKIQDMDNQASNKEIIETIIKKEVFVSYIKRTNLVKIREKDIERHFQDFKHDPVISNLIEYYGIDPLFFKINIEKQLMVQHFIQHSFLASTMVTRGEIEKFISDNPEYKDKTIDDDLIYEIELKVREEKINQRIQSDIEHILGRIHYLIDPDDIQL